MLPTKECRFDLCVKTGGSVHHMAVRQCHARNCRSGSWCSYTCTPDGVHELATLTGTLDRWSEAVIENTYGRVSLLPEPVVLPTLYMPKIVGPGMNSFTYSASLVEQHLHQLGYDLYQDFHTLLVSCSVDSRGCFICYAPALSMYTCLSGCSPACPSNGFTNLMHLLVQVLSPLPQFINPGNTAWADGGGSPLIYVMRCNPQHYYLLHEIGHRFGMPHATIYKLTNQTATAQVGLLCKTGQLCSVHARARHKVLALNKPACCCTVGSYNKAAVSWGHGRCL